MKSFLIPALALALAGCANEELETIGSGTIPAVPSGQTILFSNNTALTIGDADGVQTRAMGWTEVTDKVNSACWLEMDVKPTPSGNDVYIKSGEEEVYNRLLGKVDRHIFVYGTLVLKDNYKAGAGYIYVMDGGKLRIDGAPAKIASQLAQETEKERLYYGLPAPVRICGELGADPIPLSVRQARGYLKTILKDAKPQAEEPVKQEPEREDKPVLSCKEVWMRYASTEPDVLRGAELQLYKKEHLCLLGGNGAGKTTLLSCLIGTAKPQRGKVGLQKNCRLAMLPQRPQALFTQDDVLSDLLEVGNETDARAWAEKLELTGLLDRHPFDLSGGELQRAALCKLLLRNADVLLLDEPTKGLDAYAKAELGAILKKLNADGVSILTVTHDLDFAASFADRCAMMFDGRVISADEPHRFFSGNRYYTTDANRIAGSWFPSAITCEEVVQNCREAGR